MSGKIIAYDLYALEEARSTTEHQRVRSLEALLAASDVATLDVPLIKSIRGMIGAKQLSQTKRNAILLQVSRRLIVDKPALLQALKPKQIHDTVLDAKKVEPPIFAAYSEVFNVIMTPHIGVSSAKKQSKTGVDAVEIVFAVLEAKREPNRRV